MGKLLKLSEAAQAMNVPENTLRYWIAQGTGPASFKLGRRRMFREEDVAAYVDAQIAKDAAEKASA
ncbi:helix-turn-helix transcriptional regulator [Agromyces indicus]|uniref:Helix-turn-helix domain-containing protein n=1 Tax=Agromyces indicus TaxID=758919 RepID=A0ABU1FJH4_9MICO|nr:helix-turn-helix domain-containing protein [Agromyces indicus]MDR5691902.1 helix-turn-helix domain-containing protein [Agromyces indicus]